MKKSEKIVFKSKVILAGMFFFLTVLASCTRADSQNIVNRGAEEESTNFITEALPVHGTQDLITDVVYVRFYGGNRFIPYIAVSYFLQEVAEICLESSTHSGKIHIYENMIKGKKFSFLIDAEKDTIYCPEWYGYAGMTMLDEEITNDDVKKKMMKHFTGFSGQKPLTFDLKKYDMKIYSGIDDAYIPFCLMNQLFTFFSDTHFVYNGTDIYAITSGGAGIDMATYPSYTKSPWFTDAEGNLCERPKELIQLNYNLLRFTHDYLYGKPGYYGFADDGTGYADENIAKEADKLDFDSMLKKYAPETKKLLLSSSYREYFDGLLQLIYNTYGDLHTSPQFWLMYPKAAFTEEEEKEISKSFIKAPEITRHFSPKWEKFLKTTDELSKLRGNAKNIDVLDGGKTMIIRFDRFVCSDKDWKTFYENPAALASPNEENIPKDTHGLFAIAFHFLKNNEKYKNVENIIGDLSINGGGDITSLQSVLPYFIGIGDMYNYDVHTDTKSHAYVQGIDINLDGKTSIEDVNLCKELREKYRFAVLTSFQSFSCGNYFPIACYDNGIPIIGERSGGGSCVVGDACTAEGFAFKYSASYHLCHTDWTSVESGAPVTIEMPYEDFYDGAKLQAVMDKLIADGYYK